VPDVPGPCVVYLSVACSSLGLDKGTNTGGYFLRISFSSFLEHAVNSSDADCKVFRHTLAARSPSSRSPCEQNTKTCDTLEEKWEGTLVKVGGHAR
jgi:hypothetical protein